MTVTRPAMIGTHRPTTRRRSPSAKLLGDRRVGQGLQQPLGVRGNRVVGLHLVAVGQRRGGGGEVAPPALGELPDRADERAEQVVV